MKTKEDVDIIEELRTYTGLPLSDIVKVFEGFSFYALSSYSEKEKIKIPYFGSFYLKFEGDEISPKGREAKVTGFFSPHDFLKRIVGQLEDAKESGEYHNIDVIKRLKRDSKDALEKKLDVD